MSTAVSIEQQLAHAEAEHARLTEIWLAEIEAGRATAAEGFEALAPSGAIVRTLRVVAAHRDAIRRVVAAAVAHERAERERRALLDLPEVAAIAAVFPDAEIEVTAPAE